MPRQSHASFAEAKERHSISTPISANLGCPLNCIFGGWSKTVGETWTVGGVEIYSPVGLSLHVLLFVGTMTIETASNRMGRKEKREIYTANNAKIT